MLAAAALPLLVRRPAPPRFEPEPVAHADGRSRR
jgi:hypothetical protein